MNRLSCAWRDKKFDIRLKLKQRPKKSKMQIAVICARDDEEGAEASSDAETFWMSARQLRTSKHTNSSAQLLRFWEISNRISVACRKDRTSVTQNR